MPVVLGPHGDVPVLRADGVAASASAQEAARDALNVLPLAMLPLETAGLAGARLVKTARLESLVEVFDSGGAGSGRREIAAAVGAMAGPADAMERDAKLLQAVSRMASFDVFNLCTALRELRVAPPRGEGVGLSPRKRRELAGHLRPYTRALTDGVFGATVPAGVPLDDGLVQLHRAAVRANLDAIARRLRIDRQALPELLTRYADAALSLAYYQSCDRGLRNLLGDFSAWLGALTAIAVVTGTPANMRLVQEVQGALAELTLRLDDCLRHLERHLQHYWRQPTPLTGAQGQRVLSAYQGAIGAMLCGLVTKLTAWEQRFGEVPGSPGQRIDWLRQEMLPGLPELRLTSEQAVLDITRLSA
ncbi:hypothetical protein [Rhodospirillum centenum]|uniref:Uncharacterized protein n=1 Tax=Rhodospirillum centenum (strain ATCC 51521 / SW) TaxID=414684 RepID=B6IQZ4_RHOCS|nr:hypothetical protein [Rhodospirillum centenum]ACI97880.1 conserved hypothetical protein [Rhodospirillum centenum SW]